MTIGAASGLEEVRSLVDEETGSLVEEAVSKDEAFVFEEVRTEEAASEADVLSFVESVDDSQEAKRTRLAARTSQVCCFIRSSQ